MIRLTLRVVEHDKNHIKLSLFLNGQIVSGACGITVRISELTSFIHRLDPEEVEVDRENISDDVFHRLAGFKNTRFV